MHLHEAEPVYRFCPLCASHLELKVLKRSDPERLVCVGCGFIFYLDPKVAVGTIIETAAKRLVLVRRAIEPGYGKWVFPSGYVDRGEQIELAAIREAREECGLDVRLNGLVNIYSYSSPAPAPIVIVYAATAIAGKLEADEECLDAAEFERESIPWHELAFRSTRAGLRDYLDGRLHRHSRAAAP